MAVHIPPILVVIACKVVMAASQDPNAAFTHVENTEWAAENSMMVCQRNEVELYDPVEGMQLNQADDPVPALNPDFTDHGQCARAGITLATEWDQAHRGTPWRVWRIGLPLADRRSQHRSPHRLQAARMRASRHGGVRDRFRDLAAASMGPPRHPQWRTTESHFDPVQSKATVRNWSSFDV